MRTVYFRILIWFLGTLAVSMLAFVLVSGYINYRSGGVRPSGPKLNAFMFQESIRAYESSGAAGLALRLRQLHRYMPGIHYMTNAQGIDLASGEDRSQLLANTSEWDKPEISDWRVLVRSKSPDNQYRFITIMPPPYQVLQYALFYVLVLLAVGMVCWALALSIASPLRHLSRAVDRFGRGDLSVRVNSSRRDEIGALGNAFDQMAGRIETLLTSERRLLQDISHELRSPLARLSFAVELVKREHGDAAVVRLKKEIHRLTHLVSTLLEMTTRAEEDPSYGNLEEVRLDLILSEVVEDCGIEAAARKCRVSFTDGQPLTVLGNSELLRRAFENIISNAIRYTPEGSSVNVSLTSDASEAIIAVRDFGPGVPQELLSKIFQPFFRVDDSRNDSTGGIGLGLAIARRAIDVHHGRLNAANANPGLRIEIRLSLEP